MYVAHSSLSWLDLNPSLTLIFNNSLIGDCIFIHIAQVFQHSLDNIISWHTERWYIPAAFSLSDQFLLKGGCIDSEVKRGNTQSPESIRFLWPYSSLVFSFCGSKVTRSLHQWVFVYILSWSQEVTDQGDAGELAVLWTNRFQHIWRSWSECTALRQWIPKR